MFILFKSSGKYLGVIGIGMLVMISVFLTGYTGNDKVISAYADSLQLGSFVEPGFPFISTSVDARKLGPAFPADNIAARTLALQLGNDAYLCFDTDMLRWSVAWTGKFLPMVLMAQVSYKNFFNKNNKLTTVPGDPRIATGSYPGWSLTPSVSENIQAHRSGKPGWQPMPADQGRWKGVYTYGDKAILNYTVGNTSMYEMPGTLKFEDQIVFTRTIQADRIQKELFLIAAEVSNGAESKVEKGIACIYHNTGKDTVTAIGILGKIKSAIQAGITDQKYLTVRISVSDKSFETTIAIWKGPASRKPEFEKWCRKSNIAVPDFKKGGPASWKETVVTQGKLSPDTAAYVTDALTLPLPNVWKRNVRMADIAFFKDGRAAAVTFEGDVWTIEGIDHDLKNIKWKRFASGLHEPMSVEVVKDTIYIFGREGIVRLHDLNGDGAADYYENFSNVMAQSAESREWAADMTYSPDGGFYIAKGGSQSNGPAVTEQVAKGFRAGSSENGAILRISPDGLKSEVIATGLRGPFLGMHPEKGIVTASDQQGNFVPSTPIYLIKKGGYYGVSPTAHRNDKPDIAPPLTWIPHRVDRSSISQAWITGDKMGPLNGNLIHFSFGRPGLFRVMIDSSAKIVQGGVSYIRASYPAPTSKGTMNPSDKQLYITGFNLWGSSSLGISALIRLRYTGKPSYMPGEFHAVKQGVILGFDAELDANSAVDPARFQVKRWNYKRTEEYGSGHFKPDGSTGEETMQVAASYVSADRKKVLLLMLDMQEVMQMEVSYQLIAGDGRKMNDALWFTVNNTGELNADHYGFKNVDLAFG